MRDRIDAAPVRAAGVGGCAVSGVDTMAVMDALIGVISGLLAKRRNHVEDAFRKGKEPHPVALHMVDRAEYLIAQAEMAYAVIDELIEAAEEAEQEGAMYGYEYNRLRAALAKAKGVAP